MTPFVCSPLLLISLVTLNFFILDFFFFGQPDNKRYLGAGLQNKRGEKWPRNASNPGPHILLASKVREICQKLSATTLDRLHYTIPGALVVLLDVS